MLCYRKHLLLTNSELVDYLKNQMLHKLLSKLIGCLANNILAQIYTVKIYFCLLFSETQAYKHRFGIRLHGYHGHHKIEDNGMRTGCSQLGCSIQFGLQG